VVAGTGFDSFPAGDHVQALHRHPGGNLLGLLSRLFGDSTADYTVGYEGDFDIQEHDLVDGVDVYPGDPADDPDVYDENNSDGFVGDDDYE
jgi:hypothetical protein